MSAMVKGWCPSLARPMPSGDGLLVRVHPPGAMLDRQAALLLAAASARFGNGLIQLTSRAAIQVRGLSAATVDRFAAAMAEAGLAEASPRVVWPPLADDDPGVTGAAAAIATGIERALFGINALPDKFAVAVDGGGVLPVGDIGCDILVGCDDAGCSISLAGAPFAARVTHDGGASAVLRLAQAFLDLARPPLRRMHALVKRAGANAIFARAGLHAGAANDKFSPAAAIGWLPYGAQGGGAFGLGLPFGATTAEAFAALAARMGDGSIRLTPWRAIALTGADARRVGVASSDFIIDADDPRLGVIACPGSPACKSAAVPARTDAGVIAALRLSGPVHVSGCAKGCAHPTRAPIALVGSAGCYDLVRDGRADDVPVARGLSLAQAAALVRA